MDAVWREIREKGFSHKGLNHWVYEDQDGLFVGVELEAAPAMETTLERKELMLTRYAYWKHVGAYTRLAEVHDSIHKELRDRGLQASWPSVEVYGHHNDDETKLETEVLVSVE